MLNGINPDGLSGWSQISGWVVGTALVVLILAVGAGVALAVMVEEGQHVSAGQPLVRLDPDRARLAVAQSEAQMRKLENSYQRAQKLVQQQLVSAADIDQLRFDLENARAQYRMTALELSYTTVVAPISGVVASRDIKPGNFVQINSPIIRIVDAGKLEATLNVPEREIAKLKPGQAVELVADALPGRTFGGVVDRVSPVVDTGTGTFRVVASFSGESDLQAGMFSRLSINYDQRADALVVPRTALPSRSAALPATTTSSPGCRPSRTSIQPASS